MQTRYYEWLKLDFKPFNCTMCFSTWSSLGFYLYAYGWFGIPLAALTGITAEFIDRHLQKY